MKAWKAKFQKNNIQVFNKTSIVEIGAELIITTPPTTHLPRVTSAEMAIVPAPQLPRWGIHQ